MDIDVTRRLRPPKTPEPAAHTPLPPPPPPPAPSPQEARTIRFAAAASAASDESVGMDSPPVETDPVTGWLVVMKGHGLGRSLPLGYGLHSVGRAEDQRVKVRFGDKKISRRSHVEIAYDGKGRAFYISPGRGSTFGHLNGQPVLQPAALKAGDRIAIGDTELQFVPFCGEGFDWQQQAL